MRPSFQATLVDGPFGDPGLYVRFLFERKALLFDLGESDLSGRRLLRISHIFISHTHMDHFIGFDRLVRTLLGREARIELFGPPGFIDQVEAHLRGYTWNLVRSYDVEFTLAVHEVDLALRSMRRAQFHTRQAFRREAEAPLPLEAGVLMSDPHLKVRCTLLDHATPCLAFALEEGLHVNIWKNRLAALGLPVGPWLRDLKRAVLTGAGDDTPVALPEGGSLPLGRLKREVLRIVPGQKVAYVVDAAGHRQNREKIVALARGADQLFIEATFLERDRALAEQKYHLTARQAGEIAREAGVRQVIPLHLSARYEHDATEIEREVQAAFIGTA